MDVIEDLSIYGNGASDEVRLALQNPHDLSIQSQSFAIVHAFARRVCIYYQLAKEVEEVCDVANFYIIVRPHT